MRQFKSIAAGLMVALAAVVLGATPVVPPASPASAPAPQDPFTRELLGRLNSADPAQKSAAQQQMAAIAGFWQQTELLQKMLEATSDPELKVLLQQRINELKIRQAQLDITNLPPISLNVKTVTLTQLADALSAALGTPGKLQAPNGQGMFTLDVKNKPFWEVFAALAQQEPFTLSTFNSSLGLQSTGTPLRRYAIDGPVIGYLDSIQYRRIANLQTPGGDAAMQPPQLTATLFIGVDPRIRVNTLTGPTVTRASDDAGNTFNRTSGMSVNNGNANTSMFNTSITLQAPETLGKKISLSLDGRITAQATEIVGTLSDVANQLNTPVTVGGRSFRMQRFAVNGQTINMSIMMDSTAQPTDTPLRATAVLLDSTGKQLWTGAVSGSIAGSFGVGDSTGPYKLEMHMPDKTVEIPFHLELKDMPLP